MTADNPTAEEARERVKGWIDRPEHKPTPERDAATVDDDLEAPDKQKGKDE